MGPKPDGEIQIEQEALLRQIALWNFVKNEAVCNIRPWGTVRENNIWYTSSPDNKTVYAFVTGAGWRYGERKDFLLRKVNSSINTTVSVLGYASELVEYREGFDASIRWEQTSEGLLISAVNGLRLYTNNKLPNPVVLKIENVLAGNESGDSFQKSDMDGAE